VSWWLWLLLGIVLGVFIGRVWVKASHVADLIELARAAFSIRYESAVAKWGDKRPPRRVFDDLRDDYVILVQLQDKHVEFTVPPPAWFEEIRSAADAVRDLEAGWSGP